MTNDLSPWVAYYCQMGFAVHWLYSKSKLPIGKAWQKAPTLNANELCSQYRAGNNLGFRPGLPSLYGDKHIVVLDVDIKSSDPKHQTEVQEALSQFVNPDTHKPNVITGGGGFHYYILCAQNDLPQSSRVVLAQSLDLVEGSKKHAWQIELLATGQNCVLAPSIHPETGLYYELKHWNFIDGLPDAIRKILAERDAPINTKQTDTLNNLMAGLNTSSAETETNIARLKSALSTIPSCCGYDKWRNVLWSIQAHNWACGQQIAKTWSQECQTKYSETDFNKVWSSDKGSGIGAGTVYHIAKEYGWPATSTLSNDGDITNARLFAEKYRGKLLYCFASKRWLNWDGIRWVWCDRGEVMEAAKSIADQLVENAVQALRQAPQGEETKTKLKAAKSLHANETRLKAMLELATSENGLNIVSPAMLDNDPFMLGVKNGVVNLRTGQLQAADPKMLISRQVQAAYDLTAACPRFLQALNEIFNGDKSIIDYFQRQCGYMLTGSVDQEVLFFWYGHGANGKSVLANIIIHVMGDYAGQVSPDLLRNHRDGGSNTERATARLPGLRLAMVNETREGEIWDDGKVKELVSREKIASRFLYGEAFDFRPTHKLCIRGNHQPGIRDGSDGLWRRIHLLGFERKFAEHERITDLDKKICTQESNGVLMWMIRGALDYLKDGLKPPASVIRATAAYRASCDLLAEWLSDETKQDANARVEKSQLYASYKYWCERNGYRPVTRVMFTRSLKERGICLDPGGRNYLGIALTPCHVPLPA